MEKSEYSYFLGKSDINISSHTHTNRFFPFVVAVHVNKGEYFCCCKEKSISAKEGETLIVPEYILHDIEMKASGNLSWMHICAHIGGNDALSGYRSPFIIGSELSDNLKMSIDTLNNISFSSSIQYLKKDFYISNFFITVLENIKIPAENTDTPWQRDIKNYITENISKKFTLKELASYSNMSESSFSHKFRLEIGNAPIKYIICQKINASLSMLRDGNTINYIARTLGFSNEYYYSKQFKAVTGITPTQYRKNMI